jgi:outer membrane biosynthesis protein TonB
VVVLTGGDDDSSKSSDTTGETSSVTMTEELPTVPATPTVPETPTTPTPPAAGPAVAKPKPKPKPAPAPAAQECDPIIGNGQPYPVSTTAPSCEPGRSVLITALNGGTSATVEGWKCTVDLSATTVGACTRGGVTVKASSP